MPAAMGRAARMPARTSSVRRRPRASAPTMPTSASTNKAAPARRAAANTPRPRCRAPSAARTARASPTPARASSAICRPPIAASMRPPFASTPPSAPAEERLHLRVRARFVPARLRRGQVQGRPLRRRHLQHASRQQVREQLVPDRVPVRRHLLERDLRLPVRERLLQVRLRERHLQRGPLHRRGLRDAARELLPGRVQARRP